MAEEPENLVLEILRAIRKDLADTRAELKGHVQSLRAEFKSDMHSLRADVASDLMTMQAKNDAEHQLTRKMTSEQIAGLRRAVVEYHSAVVGHGILISDLEGRVRRREDKVGLSDS